MVLLISCVTRRRDARIVAGDVNADLEGGEVLVHRGGGALQLLPLRLAPVLLGLGQILGGHVPGPQGGDPVQQGERLLGARPVEQVALDPGEPGADLLDLEGVVVEEDEAVEAEVQRRGEVADVLALLGPVAAIGHEIVEAQRHRALLEDRAEILLVVLRHGAEQDAEALQAQELALELRVDDPRIVAVDLQVLHPVLADDAAPEGVVGVDHHHLAARPQPRRDGVGVALDQRVHGGRGVGHLVHVPVALAEGVGEAEHRQGAGGVDRR